MPSPSVAKRVNRAPDLPKSARMMLPPAMLGQGTSCCSGTAGKVGAPILDEPQVLLDVAPGVPPLPPVPGSGGENDEVPAMASPGDSSESRLCGESTCPPHAAASTTKPDPTR